MHQDVKEMAGGAEFGRLLAGFRLSRGLSQDELARRSSMSVRAIRDLERGQVDHPRRTTVALLADALGLNETDREAFDNAASGSLGRADEHNGRAGDSAASRTAPAAARYCRLHWARTCLEWLHGRVRGQHESTAVVITAVVGKAGWERPPWPSMPLTSCARSSRMGSCTSTCAASRRRP